ncbi:MAG TPA: zinc-ribbon domain-containing protein [Pyrinomonadaceae bacterium]|nr:zinc-ribbon domain-containing protein [Pyrinomonadaceae bacterium]
MIVICPNCTTRLQLEASKVPSRAFSVRCPKCQHIVNAQPPAQTSQRDALAAGGDLPSSTRAQQQGGAGASAATSAATPATAEPQPGDAAATPESEVLRLLASLLSREGGAGAASLRHVAERRRALVCAGAANGGEVVRALSRSGFDVFAPDNVPMANEALREGNVSVVVLDPEFDVRERGHALICGELAAMRMPERRRVLFVQVSDAARTGDAHAAFVVGANLVVNTKDVRELPLTLQRNIRDLNELYRDFNKALGVAEL